MYFSSLHTSKYSWCHFLKNILQRTDSTREMLLLFCPKTAAGSFFEDSSYLFSFPLLSLLSTGHRGWLRDPRCYHSRISSDLTYPSRRTNCFFQIGHRSSSAPRVDWCSARNSRVMGIRLDQGSSWPRAGGVLFAQNCILSPDLAQLRPKILENTLGLDYQVQYLSPKSFVCQNQMWYAHL